MTIEEKVKALMEGRRFKACGYGSVIYFDNSAHPMYPFMYLNTVTQEKFTLDESGAWNIEWEEIIEKPWQPEHEEKVLCRDHDDHTWRCGEYSHTIGEYHHTIGGNWFKIIAPFDKEKLGKVT